MKAVTVSANSKALKDLLNRARRRDVILESEDGEQYVLARITNAQSFFIGDTDDFASEVELTRKNKRLMKFLDERGARAKKRKGASLA
ncbi:MAG: hypothetical protein HY070_11615, partial [Chloroflexi bacterium]|nr:hypothetical protein [Chloroflexota bacterium]